MLFSTSFSNLTVKLPVQDGHSGSLHNQRWDILQKFCDEPVTNSTYFKIKINALGFGSLFWFALSISFSIFGQLKLVAMNPNLKIMEYSANNILKKWVCLVSVTPTKMSPLNI